MKKSEILGLIEQGLLDHFLSTDYSINSDSMVSESKLEYVEDEEKYSRLSNKILFKAKLAVNRRKQAKVLSILEASERLSKLDNSSDGKIFTIFKRHVEEHGLAANYRNFEAMTEEEMKEILEQLNHTALLDDIISELENE